MLYRIITEHKNFADIVTVLMQHFDGFTTYRAQGVWKNTIEPALIIEIDDVTDGETVVFTKVHYIIDAIKEMNNQECVLLQQIPSNSEVL